MKRLLVLIMISALLFTGCGSAQTEEKADDKPAEAVEVEEPETVEEPEAVEEPEVKTEDVETEPVTEKVEEVDISLEKMTMAAQATNGKAAIYFETESEDYDRWDTEIYLYYNDKLEKFPYSWFTKYTDLENITSDDIAVECRDFDGDGADEIACVRRCSGGTGLSISDIDFIENPGTEKEYHYIYNPEMGYEGYTDTLDALGNVTVVNSDTDISDVAMPDVAEDGSYVVVRRKSDGEAIGYLRSSEVEKITEVHWSCLVKPEISEDGFIMNNEAEIDYWLCPEEGMCLIRKYKYLGDGKIELSEVTGKPVE